MNLRRILFTAKTSKSKWTSHIICCKTQRHFTKSSYCFLSITSQWYKGASTHQVFSVEAAPPPCLHTPGYFWKRVYSSLENNSVCTTFVNLTTSDCFNTLRQFPHRDTVCPVKSENKLYPQMTSKGLHRIVFELWQLLMCEPICTCG